MLHPILRLQSSESGDFELLPTVQRGWLPRVIVGRELCIFESMSCRGVAWHELGSFARLQARRLAPYVHSGVSAAVRNKTLMLWFWDQEEVDAALRRADPDHAGTRLIAETLMLKLPSGLGECKLQCANGYDVMTLEGGAVIRSRWEAHRVPHTPAPTVSSRPWARDRLGGSLNGVAGIAANGASGLNRAMTALGAVAAIGVGVYAAYWGGSLFGAQKRLATLEGNAQATIERMEKLAGLRTREVQDREWVAAYRRLGGSIQLESLLSALEPALASRNLVIKELEIRNDEARLALVSAGPEIDLPDTLAVLARVPGLRDVALRENLTLNQATFTMQSSGYRRISQPLTSRPQ